MYEYKQRHILKAALQLFRRDGLRAVTMDEIAQCAGMSKKTIYIWFADKNEMVNGLYKSITNIVEHRLHKIQKLESDIVYRYAQIIELGMSAGDFVTPKVMDDLKKYYTTTYKKLRHFIDNKFMPAVAQSIDEGISQGFFQPNFDSRLMAMVCMSGLDFANETATKNLPAISNEAMKQQLARHLLYGIATGAGKKQTDKYFSITQQ